MKLSFIKASIHQKMKELSIVLSWFLFCQTLSFAQNPAQGFLSGVVTKLQYYHASTGDRRIYIHTDKDSYQPGEILYFQGYILDFYAPGLRFGGDSLRVDIAGDAGKILLSKDFLIENSIVSGNFRIPNTESGQYQLVAYSQKLTANGVGKVFIRPLLIKKDADLSLALRPGDQNLLSKNEFQYEVTAWLKGIPESSANIAFKTNNGGKTVKGSVKTDKSGKALLNVKLPENFEGGCMLQIDGKSGKSAETIYYPVIYDPSWLKPVFSPEGGKLIAGNTVIVKGVVTDIFGNTVNCQAYVVSSKGDKTVLNQKDEGLFEGNITPIAGNTYTVQLTLPGGKNREVTLPAVEENGLSLSLQSIDAQQVSFKLKVTDPEKYAEPMLVGYMQGKLIASVSLKPEGKETFINLPLDKLDAGIAHYAVVDRAGNLLSERSVFIPKMSPSIRFTDEGVKATGNIPIAQKYKLEDQAALPADLSVSVSKRTKNDFGIFSTIYVLSEIPHSFYPVLRNSQASASEGCINELLIAGKLFSWNTVMKEEGSLLTNAQQSLALKTVWVSMVQPFLLNNFRSPENAFTDRILSSVKEKKSAEERRREIYAGYTNVVDIIKSIKPFTLVNNMIIFPGGMNSLNRQEGAIIVIDGIKMGTSISVLESFAPIDIDNIEVSTKPEDIQEYTGLNSVGIVKIWTIGSANNRHFPTVAPADINERKAYSPTPGSLFWNKPEINSRNLSDQEVRFSAGNQKGLFLIRLEGLSAEGKVLWGEKELTIE